MVLVNRYSVKRLSTPSFVGAGGQGPVSPILR